MSLINDMLRDIERRDRTQAEPGGLPVGTRVVPEPRARRWPPSWMLLLAVGTTLGLLGGWLVHLQLGTGNPLTLRAGSPQTTEHSTADTAADTRPATTTTASAPAAAPADAGSSAPGITASRENAEPPQVFVPPRGAETAFPVSWGRSQDAGDTERIQPDQDPIDTQAADATPRDSIDTGQRTARAAHTPLHTPSPTRSVREDADPQSTHPPAPETAPSLPTEPTAAVAAGTLAREASATDTMKPLPPGEEIMPSAPSLVAVPHTFAEPDLGHGSIEVRILPGNRVNFRAAPSLDAPILNVFSDRNRFTLLDRREGFVQVRAADGTSGWLSADFVIIGGSSRDLSERAGDPPSPASVPPARTDSADVSSAAVAVHAPASNTPPASATPQPADAAIARPSRQETLDDMHREASRAAARGEFNVAETLLERILALDPAHAPATSALTALLLHQQRHDTLEARLRALHAHATDHPVPATGILARVLAERGETDQALGLLEARPPQAHSVHDLILLANLYQRKQRHERATQTFATAVERDPRSGHAWAGLAVSLEALNRSARARDAWARALASGSLDPALERHARARLAALDRTGD